MPGRQCVPAFSYCSAACTQTEAAAKSLDPSRMTRYAIELSTLFHKFYNACRVNVEDEALMQARLCLCNCVRDTLFSILTMLRVDAPEKM